MICLSFSALGTSPCDDPLRQPFRDGGLADARLADQHRVVLGAAREHLHHAANLLVAPDHGIELAARASAVRSRPYFSSDLVRVLRVRAVHMLVAAHFCERRL